MSKVTKHFVTFYSPGSFVFEETTQPIDSWDVREAFERSRTVLERYGARPFAFEFSTRERGDEDLDSKTVARSPRYYISGKIETREEVEARNDPKEEILRSNMRCNHIVAAVTCCSPYRSTHPFDDGAIVLDANGNEIARAPAGRGDGQT